MNTRERDALTPPLGQPVARVILLAFVALHVGLATTATGLVPPRLTAAALVLVCAAACAVVLLPGNELSRWPAVAVTLVVLAVSGVLTSQLPLAGWAGYAAWHLGAATFIALGLTLRGRIGLAWVLMASLIGECCAWSFVGGEGVGHGLALISRQAGTLLLGTLFAVALRRAARQVGALHAEEHDRHLEEQRSRAAADERVTASSRVLALATEPLQRIAAGGQVSRSERGTFLALEGRLRDDITASSIMSERLIEAAAAARRRGVDVLLLSDVRRSDLDDEARTAASAWFAERLADSATGSFTGRAVQRGAGLRLSAIYQNGSAETMLPLVLWDDADPQGRHGRKAELT